MALLRTNEACPDYAADVADLSLAVESVGPGLSGSRERSYASRQQVSLCVSSTSGALVS